MKTEKIHLDESSPLFYTALIYFCTFLCLICLHITTSVNNNQKWELIVKDVSANTIKLKKADAILNPQIKYSENYPDNLLRFYKAVNSSRDLGKPMR